MVARAADTSPLAEPAGLGATGLGQLIRYLAFFSVLLWFEIVAWHSPPGEISSTHGSAAAP